jgi:hypothetical protein
MTLTRYSQETRKTLGCKRLHTIAGLLQGPVTLAKMPVKHFAALFSIKKGTELGGHAQLISRVPVRVAVPRKGQKPY